MLLKRTNDKMIVGVLGLGKAGLPLACILADSQINVIGYDINEDLVKSINESQNPIAQEPGLGELIKKVVKAKRLSATSDSARLKDATVFIIVVPLFIDDDHVADFSNMKKACQTISPNLKRGDLVVVETTVPVGSIEGVIRKELEKSGLKAGEDFHLAYSPERIMTGYSLGRYRDFPKVVSGIDQESLDKAFDLYSRFSKVKKASSIKTAELVKISEGIYRDVNVALANELFKVSEKYGIDFWEMRDLANHEFCNIHEAGNGTGGHCIPVYPWFLIKQQDVPMTLLGRRINDGMANYFSQKIVDILKARKIPMASSRVAVLGLTYRANVKETYYTRAKALIDLLAKKKIRVFGHDFLLTPDEIKQRFGMEQTMDFNSMDVIIVLNKNPEYRVILLPFKDKVIDTKNILG